MASQLRMKVWVELVDADGVSQRREIVSIARKVDEARLDDFGLSLNEGKDFQRRVQQTDQAAQLDRGCLECGRLRNIHDWRSRTVAWHLTARMRRFGTD